MDRALGGVQEAVEGIVGRLQVKQHLAHLIIIQLVWGWHAAERGQPGEDGGKSTSVMIHTQTVNIVKAHCKSIYS